MARQPESGRRSFLRRFGIGAAGAAATVATSVIPVKAEPEIVEVVKEVPVPVPVAGGLVWATIGYGYGPLQLEAGEVFALTGLRNDYLLTGQGLAMPVDTGLGKLGIGLCNCGRRFILDNRGRQFLEEHLRRTGHKSGDATITVVDEVRVGSVARRREVRLEVNALELDEEQAYHLANRVVEALKRPNVFPDAKLEERLRAAAEFPPAAEPNPEILEVGGTLRASLIRKDAPCSRRWLK